MSNSTRGSKRGSLSSVGERRLTLDCIALLLIAACLPWAGCRSDGGASGAPSTSATRADARLPHPIPTPSIEHLYRFSPDVYSGGVPAGAAGFRALRELGVRTLVSVDGAAPDVAGAGREGLRYVHLPIGYSGVTRTQRLQIARAIAELPGPIFVHCHHGKHRSPAAAAAALVSLGRLSAEQAVEFLRVAGTSPSYPGLYADVRQAEAVQAEELSSVPCDFPEVAGVTDLVQGMVAAQEALDFLELVQEAGWRVPTEHPDLVPAALAGQIENLMRHSPPESTLSPTALQDWSRRQELSRRAASDLETQLVAGAGTRELSVLLTALSKSCRDCHRVHRDER